MRRRLIPHIHSIVYFAKIPMNYRRHKNNIRTRVSHDVTEFVLYFSEYFKNANTFLQTFCTIHMMQGNEKYYSFSPHLNK